MGAVPKTESVLATHQVRRAPHALRDIAAALLLAALLLAASLVALRVTPVYDAGVTAGGGRATNKVGFYGVEYDRAGAPYRWTAGAAFVQMPYAYRAAPAYLAEVRLRAEHPRAPQPLTFLANERPLATVTPSEQFRVYQLALPPPTPAEPELRLGLRTEPFRPAEHPRPLGVIVSDAALRPVPLTDWPLVLTLTLGPAALLLLLRALDHRAASATARTAQPAGGRLPVAKPGPDLLVAAALGAALLLLVWRAQPAPLRPEWMAWAALLGAAAAALVARSWPARLGMGLLGALAAFSGALWPAWLTDDAFISFRYAQNLVAGHGLVYNIGERVEGYTNFLWTVLAALALALGADIVVFAYAAGVAIALALIIATYAVGRPLLGPGWALVAALFVGTSQSLLVYTARGGGLETGLFALLALLASGAYLGSVRAFGRSSVRAGQRRLVLAGLLFGLATLTRPEGALLLALTALHCAVTGLGRATCTMHRGPWPGEVARHIALLTLPCALVVLPFFAWRLGYYGDPLPNTFYVKAGGGPGAWLRGLAYLGSFALDFGGPLLLFAPLALLAARRSQSYLLLLCVTYAAYVGAVGGDHFPGHRFLVPLVPWLALLMAGGMAAVLGRLIPRAPRIATALLAVLLIAYSGYALTRSARYDAVLAGNDESLWLWAEIGAWLHDNTAADESVAAMGAGAIAFYADRPVIDLLGLTERHIARVPSTEGAAPGHEKRDPAYVLDVRRPTYIPRIWDDYFGGPGALRGRYELITVTTRTGRAIELWRLKESTRGSLS